MLAAVTVSPLAGLSVFFLNVSEQYLEN